MTFTTPMRALARAATLSLVLAACGPKDADIKTSIDQAITGVPGVSVDVTGGVATISGEFADSAARTSTEATVRGVKGVKSVVNNATVTPPVVISPDQALKANVDSVLKAFPTLTANVADGVVTLTGEIQRSELPRAMQALSALNPKKIDNKATVKR